jgi:hypothetical protein
MDNDRRKMMSNILCRLVYGLVVLAALAALAGCGSSSTVNAAQPQQTVTINPNFQSQISPLPTIPPYRCGAWASNNAPGASSTIVIYSRLTHNAQGVSGISATADVHFQSGDVNLGTATSDSGGYVTFTLPLQGRQPAQIPATVDVTFNGLPGGGTVRCTAFFTPG